MHPPASCRKIISLGRACDIAFHIRRCFGQEEAYPFDWLITPVEALTTLVRTDFDGFLDPASLFARPKGVLDRRLGIHFRHDWSQPSALAEELAGGQSMRAASPAVREACWTRRPPNRSRRRSRTHTRPSTSTCSCSVRRARGPATRRREALDAAASAAGRAELARPLPGLGSGPRRSHRRGCRAGAPGSQWRACARQREALGSPPRERARSSAGEHHLDTVGVTGSIPVAPIPLFLSYACA